jgi:hypothetical protein
VETARQERRVESPTRAFRRILERATDLGVTDLAEQHDRYLYGCQRSRSLISLWPNWMVSESGQQKRGPGGPLEGSGANIR